MSNLGSKTKILSKEILPSARLIDAQIVNINIVKIEKS